jgi:electron transfer flavoprotein beta subunit
MKKALAMGCDRGVHVADDQFYAKDPMTIAGIIAEYAKDQNFTCIFTGMQSQDRGSGQVGVLLAEMLGLPAVTTIVDFVQDGGKFSVKRELEGGIKALVTVQGPALFTCQLGLNTPRYPTLPNIMKAKKKELVTLPVAQLQKTDALQETDRLYFPEKKSGGLILEGEAGELADRLIGILKEKTAVLA